MEIVYEDGDRSIRDRPTFQGRDAPCFMIVALISAILGPQIAEIRATIMNVGWTDQRLRPLHDGGRSALGRQRQQGNKGGGPHQDRPHQSVVLLPTY
jgi:hypothetical protein